MSQDDSRGPSEKHFASSPENVPRGAERTPRPYTLVVSAEIRDSLIARGVELGIPIDVATKVKPDFWYLEIDGDVPVTRKDELAADDAVDAVLDVLPPR